MMKKYIYYLVAAVAAMFSMSSCSNDEVQDYYIKQEGSAVVNESDVKGTWTSISSSDDSTYGTYSLSLSLNSNGSASYTITYTDLSGSNNGYTIKGESSNYSFDYGDQEVIMYVSSEYKSYKDGVTSTEYNENFSQWLEFWQIDDVMVISTYSDNIGYNEYYCTK